MARSPSPLASDLLDVFDRHGDGDVLTDDQQFLLDRFHGWVDERRQSLETLAEAYGMPFAKALGFWYNCVWELIFDADLRATDSIPARPPGDIWAEQLILNVIKYHEMQKEKTKAEEMAA